MILSKKNRLLIRYYFKIIQRQFWSYLPLILFLISLITFSLILIPNTILRVSPIFGKWPRVLEINGVVLSVEKRNDTEYTYPVSNAKIEIGGYITFTDNEGTFKLNFVSKNIDNIPVLISYSKRYEIKRITFSNNEFKKREIFNLDDG